MGEIVHCFNVAGMGLFVVVSFNDMPELVSTLPLRNVIPTLWTHNVKNMVQLVSFCIAKELEHDGAGE